MSRPLDGRVLAHLDRGLGDLLFVAIIKNSKPDPHGRMLSQQKKKKKKKIRDDAARWMNI